VILLVFLRISVTRNKEGIFLVFFKTADSYYRKGINGIRFERPSGYTLISNKIDSAARCSLVGPSCGHVKSD
jgi:hypothetical protein